MVGIFKISITVLDVEFWEPNNRTVRLSNSEVLHYNRLCIATGALPRTVAKQPLETIIQIRDTDTIESLRKELKDAKRLVIIGDGGIAMEAAFELMNLEIFWASKTAFVGGPFFDITIGLALEERFNKGREEGEFKREVVWGSKYAVQKTSQQSDKLTPGCSLGPNWLAKLRQPVKDEQVRQPY